MKEDKYKSKIVRKTLLQETLDLLLTDKEKKKLFMNLIEIGCLEIFHV